MRVLRHRQSRFSSDSALNMYAELKEVLVRDRPEISEWLEVTNRLNFDPHS